MALEQVGVELVAEGSSGFQRALDGANNALGGIGRAASSAARSLSGFGREADQADRQISGIDRALGAANRALGALGMAAGLAAKAVDELADEAGDAARAVGDLGRTATTAGLGLAKLGSIVGGIGLAGFAAANTAVAGAIAGAAGAAVAGTGAFLGLGVAVNATAENNAVVEQMKGVQNSIDLIAKGVPITTGALQSMEEKGIPATAALAKSMGMTEEQVRKMAEQGFIPAGKDIAAMTAAAEGRMAELKEAHSRTFYGMVRTMNAFVQESSAMVSKPIFDALKVQLGRLADATKDPAVVGALASLGTRVQEATDRVGEALKGTFQPAQLLTGIFNGMSRVVETTSTAFANGWPKIKGWGEAIGTVSKELAGPVIQGMKHFGQQLSSIDSTSDRFRSGVQRVGDVFEFLGRVMAASSKIISGFVSGLVTGLAPTFEKLAKGMDSSVSAAGGFEKVLQSLFSGSKSVGEVVGSMLGKVIEAGVAIGKFVADIAPIAVKVFEVAQAFSPLQIGLQTLQGFLEGGISGAVYAFIGAIDQAGDAIGIDLSTPLNTLTGIFDNVLVPAFNNFVSFLNSSILPALQSFGKWVGTTFGPVFEAISKAFTTNILPALGKFGDFFGKEIMPKVDSFVQMIATHLKPVIEGVATFVANNVVPTLAKFGEIFINNIGPAISGVIDIVRGVAEPAIKTLSEIFQNTLLPILTEVANFLSSNVAPAFDTVMKFINANVMPVLKELANFLGGVLSGAFKALESVVKIVWDGIKGAVTAAWNIISGIFNTIKSVLSGDFSQAWEGLKSAVKGVWDGIETAIKTAWGLIETTFNTIKGVLGDSFKGAWTSLEGAVKGVWSGIEGAIKGAWQAIEGIFKTIGEVLGGTFKKAWETTETVVKGVWDGIKGAIEKAWEIISGIWNGLVETIGKGVGVVKALAEGDWSKAWDIITGKADDSGKRTGEVLDTLIKATATTDTEAGRHLRSTGGSFGVVTEKAGEAKQKVDEWNGLTVLAKSVVTNFGTIAEQINNALKALQTFNNTPVADKTPRVGAYASGTSYHPGGLAMLAERGGELARLPGGILKYFAGPTLTALPRGTEVFTAAATARMMAGAMPAVQSMPVASPQTIYNSTRSTSYQQQTTYQNSYNLAVNTNQTSQGVMQDYATMQLMQGI